MDKVFERSAPEIVDERLVPVHIAVHEPHPPPNDQREDLPSTGDPSSEHHHSWLIPLLTGVAAAAVVSCGWLIGHWQNSLALLEQERIALLIERLRDQPSTPQKPQETTSSAPSPELTTPPITSLKPLTLPIRTIPEVPVREVPPPAPSVPNETLPLLTGVVQGPGGASSAIFQFGQSSVTAGIGEGIGSSGWVLTSISDTGAVIERNGQRQSLSVGGVF